MFINLYSRKFTTFIADVSADMVALRGELIDVINNAGIAIVDSIDDADCSIHILGEIDIYTTGAAGYNTSAGNQFRSAKAKCGDQFKMFVWNPAANINNSNSYITNIRRDIVENTVYSDRESPIVFVEDIRNIMNVKQTEVRRHEPADIFFLYNELDNDTATGIYNMLRDFLNVSKLGISMSSEVDYSTYISEQLADSKIGVVYYNFAGDWAVSFARQIWKDSGGNSSHTPILIVGNSSHAKIEDLAVLKGIMPTAINEQLRIPLDIKVFLDKQYQK
ncbi:MAG: hypothetical protein J5826_04985 [Bacteroidales bacterium]|nr:hypothetical protein [Bacteroidales bacterium]